VILILVLGLRKGPLDVIAEHLETRRQAMAQQARDAAEGAARKKP
jgi:branched-chain amino acid transport system permease protein